MQATVRYVWHTRVLRSIAVLIAIAAVIDPAIRSARSAKPVIAVLSSTPSRDSALLARARSALAKRFTILPEWLPTVAGTVVVGARIPASREIRGAPAVVVSRVSAGPSVEIRRIQAPTHAHLDRRVTVQVTAATHGFTASKAAAPLTVDVELLQGARVVAREHIVASRDTVHTVSLAFIPTAAEPVVLEARAAVRGAADTVRSDVMIDVHDRRWSVLFFDRRPSWMSTFVRRALERDPRFAVTSRVVTSSAVSRETGHPPAGLDALAATSLFDAVVIGAPDALTTRDVDGITTLLRARGASVLILADHASAGPVDRVINAGNWRTMSRRTPAELTSPPSRTPRDARDRIVLKALAIGVPSRLPPDAESLVEVEELSTNANARAAGRQTVIWRESVGMGELVVSGAFDAWRFRDSAQSTFNDTWRTLIDEAASTRQHPLDVQLARSLVQPGEALSITVTRRDSSNVAAISASLQPARSNDPSTSASSDERIPLVIRNSAVSAALVRAPAAEGRYEIVVAQGIDTTRAPLVVAPVVNRDAGSDDDVANAWAHSRGGRLIPRDSVESLGEGMAQLVRRTPLVVTWHPMRSPWWIVPFALALAAEWWVRRRNGLA